MRSGAMLNVEGREVGTRMGRGLQTAAQKRRTFIVPFRSLRHAILSLDVPLALQHRLLNISPEDKTHDLQSPYNTLRNISDRPSAGL